MTLEPGIEPTRWEDWEAGTPPTTSFVLDFIKLSIKLKLTHLKIFDILFHTLSAAFYPIPKKSFKKTRF
jgi:hypothetical protein